LPAAVLVAPVAVAALTATAAAAPLAATTAPLGVTTYTSPSAYTAAVGPQSTEGFQNGAVAPTGLLACNLSESSTSDDQCFTPGALLPGVTYEAGGVHPLDLVGPDHAGLTDAQPSDFLESGTSVGLDFSTPQTSIGLDVVDPSGTGPQTCTLTLTGLVSVAIGTVTVPCGETPTFIGFTSPIPVSTLTVSDGDTSTGIDNVAFGLPTGLPGSGAPTGLPEAPLTVGLPLAALGAGAWFVRRRRGH
jgi:hypothetical protein